MPPGLKENSQEKEQKLLINEHKKLPVVNPELKPVNIQQNVRVLQEIEEKKDNEKIIRNLPEIDKISNEKNASEAELFRDFNKLLYDFISIPLDMKKDLMMKYLRYYNIKQ